MRRFRPNKWNTLNPYDNASSDGAVPVNVTCPGTAVVRTSLARVFAVDSWVRVLKAHDFLASLSCVLMQFIADILRSVFVELERTAARAVGKRDVVDRAISDARGRFVLESKLYTLSLFVFSLHSVVDFLVVQLLSNEWCK